MVQTKPFDRILFGATVVLTFGGFLIFISASLGLLTSGGASFTATAAGQLVLGVIGGFVALYVTSMVPYRLWRRVAFLIFGVSVLATLAVFIPHFGLSVNGARRWLDFGFTTFQPAEVLKIAYVLFLATWLARKPSHSLLARVAPLSIITAIAGAVLLVQPDVSTFLVIIATGGAMYVASGARTRDIIILCGVGIIGVGVLFFTSDTVHKRIITFLNPAHDPLGASYQVRQSLIAVGSGQVFGRGFGQSIQKFSYLPEATSDSIFAVYAEEFGFVGSLALILGFLVFGLRALWVAVRVPDLYGGLIVIGIVILISGQAFLNIASMVGVFPNSGLPLPLVSHGGTALASALASIGILLNVSRARRIG